MDATFTNSGFILKEETADDVWIFEATFARANQPNNVGRTERTISIEPLLDAPIVPIKSAEVKNHQKTHAQAEASTSEINIAALIIGGLMIGSFCFATGYIIATEQHRANTLEVKNDQIKLHQSPNSTRKNQANNVNLSDINWGINSRYPSPQNNIYQPQPKCHAMMDKITLPAWIREISFSWFFVLFLAVVLWGGSLILYVYNDSEKARLTKNNLQLVKDNRELRENNKKLIALEKCLNSSGFELEPKK